MQQTLQTLIRAELTEAQLVLENFINDPRNLKTIESAARLLVNALKTGGTIFTCGNGGSHCDAMHFAEELTGRYRGDRPALAGLALADVSHLTCVGNDYGYEFVFSRFIDGVGRSGDVLVGLSTSGNSANIRKAIHMAKSKGMATLVLTGKDGGQLAGQGDVEIRVPHGGYADRIQEIHGLVIHILILLIEKLMVDDQRV